MKTTGAARRSPLRFTVGVAQGMGRSPKAGGFQAELVCEGPRRTRLAATVAACGSRFVRVRTAHPLAAGRRVRVRFRLPETLDYEYAGLRCDFPARVRRCADSGSGAELVLRWDERLDRQLDGVVRRHWARVCLVFAPLLAIMAWLRFTTARHFWHDPFVYFYSIGVGSYFLSRFVLAALHRPPEPAGYEPSLSVVIAVRNEEAMIGRTVESCFAAEYPARKLEVIVVNDGSTDGTLSVLRAHERRYPRLKVFSLPPSGKRHGMARGVREASGELIVFVDSDTLLHEAALRQIVSGFEDPELGAVSGYCSAYNAERNLLTRMTDVRYFLSFELLKRAEALFGCVTCCPGVLSAYRRDYVARILDEWLNQKFLGTASTFGDDRSLTNYIMRDYRVDYNPNAVCTTIVPETWGNYLRQQVRWKKSWARESLIAATFIWRKNPIAVLSFYLGAMVSLLSPFMIYRAVYLELVDPEFMIMHYVLGLVILAVAMGVFTWLRRPALKWLTAAAFVAAQIFVHGPQTYYALLTIRRNHWGTR